MYLDISNTAAFSASIISIFLLVLCMIIVHLINIPILGWLVLILWLPSYILIHRFFYLIKYKKSLKDITKPENLTKEI